MHSHHYSHVPYVAHHASGAGGWFGRMLISGFVHAAIYHLLSPIFHAAGPIGSIVLGVIIILIAFAIYRRFAF